MSEQPNYLFKLYSDGVLVFESYDIVDVLWHYLENSKSDGIWFHSTANAHIDRDDLNLFKINKDGTLVIM